MEENCTLPVHTVVLGTRNTLISEHIVNHGEHNNEHSTRNPFVHSQFHNFISEYLVNLEGFTKALCILSLKFPTGNQENTKLETGILSYSGTIFNWYRSGIVISTFELSGNRWSEINLLQHRCNITEDRKLSIHPNLASLGQNLLGEKYLPNYVLSQIGILPLFVLGLGI